MECLWNLQLPLQTAHTGSRLDRQSLNNPQVFNHITTHNQILSQAHYHLRFKESLTIKEPGWSLYHSRMPSTRHLLDSFLFTPDEEQPLDKAPWTRFARPLHTPLLPTRVFIRIRSCGLCKVLEPPDWLRESLGWKCSSLAHVSALFFGQIHSQALLFLSSYSLPVLDCHSLSQTRRQSPLHTQPSSLSSSLK
ncbi:hypothetical protein IGI04_042460, partial [Brassica rapa subsp. trilocularis]